LNGLTITAYNAGHSLGGTIWHIQHGMESIVYAVDWNQVRENVLSGAAWLGGSGAGGAEVIEQLRKPTALVCSAKGVERVVSGGRTKRDELMLDTIKSAVAKGGTVLIPTDSSARVLELAYLLDHAWAADANNIGGVPLKSVRIYLATKSIGATMRYARSMIEWMDENVVREFEAEMANPSNRQHKRMDNRQTQNHQSGQDQAGRADTSTGPFDFKYIKLLERKSQIEKVLAIQGPKVILASDTTLSWGFSREILHRIAADSSSLVILTEDYGNTKGNTITESHGISRTLWGWYQERRDGVATEPISGGQHLEQVYSGGRDLVFSIPGRVILEGNELLLYQQFLATQRQLQNVANSGGVTSLESSADAIDETSSTSSSSSEESDQEHQGKALNFSATLAQANKNKAGTKETLGVNVLLRQPGVYDYDVRGKKGREALFPYATKRRRGDDFGELIRPEDYLRAEERDEVDGQDMRDAGTGKNAPLGQKRKWQDHLISLPNGRGPLGGSKRRKSDSGRPGMQMGHEPVQMNGNNTGDGEYFSDGSDDDTEEHPVGPSKLVYNSTTVQVNLRIAHVDFAGLHDQRSLSMLIPLIQPRKIVLVGGTESETAWLAEECKQKLASRSGSAEAGIMDDIFTPVVGETVSASMGTHAWTVKLSETLVRRLHWQNVKGLGIVTLMGHLEATVPQDQSVTEAARRKRQKMLKEDIEPVNLERTTPDSASTKEVPPTLDILPAAMVAETRSVAQPLHVGDLRLADLRKVLQSTGHTAEFRGEGTLVIDGLVAVRKLATGQVEVEGGQLRLPPGYTNRDREASFHAVKRRIYEGLAIIAGG
jgi:cleavage and polyadenylation specificity factor subunit 2